MSSVPQLIIRYWQQGNSIYKSCRKRLANNSVFPDVSDRTAESLSVKASILADLQLIFTLSLPDAHSEQMGGSARGDFHYNSANVYTLPYVCVSGFNALGSLLLCRATGVLTASQVSQETRGTEWVTFGYLIQSLYFKHLVIQTPTW